MAQRESSNFSSWRYYPGASLTTPVANRCILYKGCPCSRAPDPWTQPGPEASFPCAADPIFPDRRDLHASILLKMKEITEVDDASDRSDVR